MKYQKSSTPTPHLKDGPHNLQRRLHRLRRGAALLFVSAIAFTACGADGEPVSAGSSDIEDSDISDNGIGDPADDAIDDPTGLGEEDTETVQDRDENGELKDYEQAIADGSDDPVTDYTQPIDEPLDDETRELWARLLEADVVSPDEILDPKPWEIVETFALTADDDEVIVRYEAGSPPCTQSRATVVETATSIEVSLEVGLHPNVAAMSCIAQVVNTEIAVPLANPVGDREIVAIQP